MKRIKRLFTAWRANGTREGQPPPPDFTIPLRVDGRSEKVVEVLESAHGPWRVGVTKDGSRIYRIRPETWGMDWELTGQASWFANGHLVSVSDGLEQAREQARECLDAMEGPAGSGD